MSHHSLIIIGEDESQLLPFAMLDTEIEGIPVLEKETVTERLLEWHNKNTKETFEKWLEELCGIPVIGLNEEPDITGIHRFSYARKDEEGTVVSVIERENPNGKWDAFQPGGRWSDFFLLYDGTRTHSAVLKDIDFSGMARTRLENSLRFRSEVFDVLRGFPPVKPFREILREVGDVTTARKVYFEQPGVQNLIEKDTAYDVGDVLEPDLPEFVEKMTILATTPFAFIKEGEWHERGEMHWFGCVDERIPLKAWSEFCTEQLYSLPPETVLSVYDIHC